MKLYDYAIQSLATRPVPAILREEPLMTKDDMLKMLDQFSMIIGCLEHKWQRPQSELEALILQMLLDMRETVRRAYEAMGNEETR